ncbi:MAG: hypothetical protein KDA96_19070 [Planctomycetaceae bacterium]|nr:hypothetical protein [Planctomycetaceae bacterium]
MSEFRSTVNAIRSDGVALAAATAEDWSAVRARLETPEVEVTDPRPWTYSTIGTVLGAEAQIAARRLMQSLAAATADLADAHQLLLVGDGKTTGLRLDLQDRQDQLDELIAAHPENAALLTAVKRLGRRTMSIAQQHGIANTTETALAADWAQAALQDLWVARRAVIDEQIETGELTSVAAVVAVLEA